MPDANNKSSGGIRDDVVTSDFLSGRSSSPTPLHVTAGRPEDDVEEAELATEPEEVDEEEEEVEEEEEDSPEAHLRDVTQRIKYLHEIESIHSLISNSLHFLFTFVSFDEKPGGKARR